MCIETTININKDLLEKVTDASIEMEKSVGFVFSALLVRVVRYYKVEDAKVFKRIKYQDKDKKRNWKRKHLYLREAEYEYCLDLKKAMKMSLSKILREAIQKFLDEIVFEVMNKNKQPDNYHISNYCFLSKTIDDIILFQFYWGISHIILET